jgi:hypothetical protein
MTDLPLMIGAAMHRATPRSAPAVVVNDERWSVLLSSDYTMCELLAMMSGLAMIGICVQALQIGEGLMMLRPEFPHVEPPTALQLLECMRLGKQSTARLVVIR